MELATKKAPCTKNLDKKQTSRPALTSHMAVQCGATHEPVAALGTLEKWFSYTDSVVVAVQQECTG